MNIDGSHSFRDEKGILIVFLHESREFHLIGELTVLYY